MSGSDSPGFVAPWIILAGLLLVAAHGAWADEEFNVPIGQRQLFLDDHGVAGIENLTRTMHQPAKKGAVIRPNTALGVDSVQLRMAPVWSSEKKVWQLWDCAATPPDLSATGKGGSGYYESTDGLHWSTPAVGEIKYERWPENNYVFVPFQGRTLRTDYLVYDATDPDPSRRYKCALPPQGFAVSADGIRWKMLSGIEGVPSEDEANFSFDEKGHLFILTVKIGTQHGRSVGLATSKDFEHWTNHGLIFHADDIDQKHGRERIKAYLADPTRLGPFPKHQADYMVDVYNFGLFRYEGLYIGLPAMHHRFTHRPPPSMDDSFFHVIQLTCSRDLKNWTRLGDRQPWIDVSRLGSGAYDSRVILPPSNAVVRGPGCLGSADKLSKDQLWFYYTAGKAEPVQDGMAICLAVLRRDGFISLDAGDTEGTVLTMPFTLPGGELFVNVDALKGELRVEALDKNGKVLAASAPMTGNLLHQSVPWKQGAFADLKDQAVSLRFKLHNGQLYSYWLE